MFINQAQTKIVSSVYWADKGGLWIYDIPKAESSYLDLDSNHLVKIWQGKGDYFSVLYKNIYSVRDLNLPDKSLCDFVFEENGLSVKGEVSHFINVPRYFTQQSTEGSSSLYDLVEIDLKTRQLKLYSLNWFSVENEYDTGYQSVIGAYELPNDDIMVSLQRSNELHLLDGESKQLKDKISTPGVSGNPSLFISEKRNELWADNYDFLNKLDLNSYKVLQSKQVQPLFTEEDARRNNQLKYFSPGKSHGFIGKFLIDEDRGFCVVPRPFMGDVVILDLDTMDVTYTAETGRYPLQAVFVANKTVYARDWKTGDLLKADVK